MRLAAVVCLAFLAGESHESEIRRWRAEREARLRADDGWLTLAGLFWLKEGVNRIESLGEFELRDGKVTARLDGQARELRPDTTDAPDVITRGDRQFLVIRRGERFGIRLRDRNSPYRRSFTGLEYFPIDPAYRVAARFVAAPRKIPIASVVGITESMLSPGYAEFTLHGRRLRLYPVLETADAKELFFIFRDRTSGKETYGAGRYLYSEMPRDGKVVLDFNKAYNPPCAFTPYATCPLPPRKNRLPVRVEAGELKHGEH
jgi:hypothetical protein